MPLSVCSIKFFNSLWNILVILLKLFVFFRFVFVIFLLLYTLLIFWHDSWLFCQIKSIQSWAYSIFVNILAIGVVNQLYLLSFRVGLSEMAFDPSSSQRFSFTAPQSLLIKWFSFTSHASKSCNGHLGLSHFIAILICLLLILPDNLWFRIKPKIGVTRLLIPWWVFQWIFTDDYSVIHKNIDLAVRWKLTVKYLFLLWWRWVHKIRSKYAMWFGAMWRPSVNKTICVLCALKYSFVGYLKLSALFNLFTIIFR